MNKSAEFLEISNYSGKEKAKEEVIPVLLFLTRPKTTSRSPIKIIHMKNNYEPENVLTIPKKTFRCARETFFLSEIIFPGEETWVQF